MTLKGLDELDRHILYTLQADARHASSKEIAERMDVSPSTVRKRIQRLEDEGIISGYHAEVDFERAGYQLLVQIVCTAPITDRERLADRAIEVPGVVSVREIAVGEENLLVSVVAADNDDLTRIASDLSELGLAVSDEQLIRGERFAPYRGFAGDTEGE
ncbi:Lrp/AsnC family transcriptional regulator [Salinirubellus sp. GCM10025818]|jgi:DNA-binding Lrp family transcriptional regulator|uniref:Lrp/AsnC family transcriptional regulator n=1 Tax=Salinirubellus TaxID=2162630 RepID=UPI0030D349F3